VPAPDSFVAIERVGEFGINTTNTKIEEVRALASGYRKIPGSFQCFLVGIEIIRPKKQKAVKETLHRFLHPK
jgi:hypothetical protein